ncbi:MAG: MYG1 family protein [Polyangiaceae bacterium]
MVQTIVTHPGGAHKDDLLAVCVLAALHGAPIERREPTEGDLDDPETAVVDVGGRSEPTKLNFDHHHFPRDHAPTCALSLVLEHLGLYDDAKLFCEWLEPAEWFDSRGPNKTAEWLGVPRRAIAKLHSPIDVTLLRRFAQAKSLAPGETLYEVLRFVGQDLLDYLHQIREQIDAVASRVETWTLDVDGDAVEVLFFPRSEPMLDEPRAALASYLHAEGREVAATIYPDRRGTGYGISRYEDHPHLDFSALDGAPDVHFAHKSGFMCKTSATTRERLSEIVATAWRAAG